MHFPPGMMRESAMRYSKFTEHLETPRGFPQRTAGKWYDLREFLELKDLEERERRAPRPPRVRHLDPLASSSDYIPHTLGHDIEDDE